MYMFEKGINDAKQKEHDIKCCTIDALNTIDFMPYIKKYNDLYDLKSGVEKDYDDTEITKNDILEGCIFNWFGFDDIILYIRTDIILNIENAPIM